MRTVPAWLPILALLCLTLASCGQSEDARARLTPPTSVETGLTANTTATGSAVAEDVTVPSLLKDLRDPDVQKEMRLFRREYRLALAGLGGSARVDAEERLRGIYEKYVDRVGVNGILNFLEASMCHSEGHPVGKIIYARLQDMKAAIHLAADRCTNAVFHGVLMEAFASGAEHLNLLRIEDDIDRVCTVDGVAAPQNLGNCAHGVGHAVMFLAGFDVERSMQACKQLARPQLQYYCASGAFMEYDGVHGKEDMEKSLHYPCDTLTEFPAACYRYKMHWTVPEMLARGQDTEDIANECMGLKRMRRLGCFHGMGLALLPQISQSPESIRAVCGFGDADDQRMCVEGVIEKLADFDESLALDACEHLDGSSRSVCLNSARDHDFSLDKDFSLYTGDQR